MLMKNFFGNVFSVLGIIFIPYIIAIIIKSGVSYFGYDWYDYGFCLTAIMDWCIGFIISCIGCAIYRNTIVKE